MTATLPSWRPGATRDALLEFLGSAGSIPVPDRVAYFDIDGTLWCERPTEVQFDFFLSRVRERVAEDPSVADQPELAAVLNDDREAVAAMGLTRVVLALLDLYLGLTPDEFNVISRDFFVNGVHTTTGRPLRSMVYQPMLELIGELRQLEFTVGVVTGSGTEFIRAISKEVFGVPPELVVGTLIGYEFGRDGSDRPELRRTGAPAGGANEGPAKVSNIQTQLGRRPVLAAGNSAGDREMLEWAMASPNHGIALLIDHDDADREYAYASKAATFAEAEPITDMARRLGWITVSMARDWETVFPGTDA